MYGAGAVPGQGPPTVTPPAAPSSNPAMMGNPIDPPAWSPAAILSAGDSKDTGRKRSGSNAAQAQAKEVLNDIATQSKKQLNAFISRLGGDKDKDKEEALHVNTGQTFSHGHIRSVSEKPAMGWDAYMPPGAGSSGQGRPPSALKGVKLRREMDEAGE